MKSPNGIAVVVPLFPEAANQNERDAATSWAVAIAEEAHAGDGIWAYMPIAGFGQATDSTMRGFL
jgi:hypothetical protein